MVGRKHNSLLAVLGLALVAVSAPVLAQGLSEHEVKAAFIYNFIKYTEWPAAVWSKPGSLRLCVAGPKNGLVVAVDGLKDKPPIQGKTVDVIHVSRAAEVPTCHVLVLTAGDRIEADWIKAAAAVPVLTIGDARDFAAAGGVVGLYRDDDKVRFEINNEAARRAGLKLSSQLLKLARLIN